MSGVCLIAVFLAVNVVTAPLTPTVWMDEVNYSDPAVHWYLGSGFTSSCWWEQTQDQFWSGNVPGHEFLLCGWLSIFGFGVTAVRSMNFVLAAAGAGLLVAALARAGWLVTRGAQIALLVLFMTGHGITFSYRSGRPDMIGMLLAGIAAFAATLPARPRLIGLAAVGVLTPIAGLQFVVCGVVVAAVAVAGSARSALRPAIVWGVGVGIGLGGLLGLYTAQNTLAGFRASVFPLTGLAQSFADRLTQIPGLYVQDWSLPLLAITALGLAVTGRVGRRAAGCIVLAGLIPLVLFGAGRYPVYYTWMGFVPAAVAVALLLDNAGAAARRWAWIGVAAACVVGLPLRLTLTATEYAARDYGRVEAVLSPAVSPDDVVFGDYAAYYPCRAKARNVYMPGYLAVIRPWEKAEVTVLVCSPDALADYTARLGGDWVPTGEAVKPLPPPSWAGPLRKLAGGARLYDLAVYRRRPAGGSP